MSNLRLFWPSESDTDVSGAASDDEPAAILPFQLRATGSRDGVARRAHTSSAVRRARVLFENRCCPWCDRLNVEPIQLDDAVISLGNHEPVPGTATIVGFRCRDCASEWPAYGETSNTGAC